MCTEVIREQYHDVMFTSGHFPHFLSVTHGEHTTPTSIILAISPMISTSNPASAGPGTGHGVRPACPKPCRHLATCANTLCSFRRPAFRRSLCWH